MSTYVPFLTCKFFPLWQWWWHRIGRCLRRGWGRAPPKEKTSRSLPWSSYGHVPPWEGAQGVQPSPRCFLLAPSRGRRLTLRWGEAWGLHPADSGCLRWVWSGWWPLRCWGYLFWMPVPRLNTGNKEEKTGVRSEWWVTFLNDFKFLLEYDRI